MELEVDRRITIWALHIELSIVRVCIELDGIEELDNLAMKWIRIYNELNFVLFYFDFFLYFKTNHRVESATPALLQTFNEVVDESLQSWS